MSSFHWKNNKCSPHSPIPLSAAGSFARRSNPGPPAPASTRQHIACGRALPAPAPCATHTSAQPPCRELHLRRKALKKAAKEEHTQVNDYLQLLHGECYTRGGWSTFHRPSTACGQKKPTTAMVFLLPQDGVNAVYLVIRMLFLAFFTLAELVFMAPLLLSCWGSWL